MFKLLITTNILLRHVCKSIMIKEHLLNISSTINGLLLKILSKELNLKEDSSLINLYQLWECLHLVTNLCSHNISVELCSNKTDNLDQNMWWVVFLENPYI